MKRLAWRLGMLSFVLSAVVGVVALHGAVEYVGPQGTFCTSSDYRNGTCAQAWNDTMARGVVLVGGHTAQARVSSSGWLTVSRIAFAAALGLLLVPVLRRRT